MAVKSLKQRQVIEMLIINLELFFSNKKLLTQLSSAAYGVVENYSWSNLIYSIYGEKVHL